MGYDRVGLCIMNWLPVFLLLRKGSMVQFLKLRFESCVNIDVFSYTQNAGWPFLSYTHMHILASPVSLLHWTQAQGSCHAPEKLYFPYSSAQWLDSKHACLSAPAQSWE